MATFKAVALKDSIRADKTVRLKICVRHNLERKYIDTGLTATLSDLTKTLDIKNQNFKDSCEDIIRGYRAKCNANPALVERIDCKQLVSFLTTEPETNEIDFIKFAEGEIAKLNSSGHTGGAVNRQTALNALLRFTGTRVLPVQNITAKFLHEFEAFIKSKPLSNNNKAMVRAPSLYMAAIRSLHNELKLQYNDEDIGIIRVPYSPFSKYKVPKEKLSKKRAIDIETIRSIINLPNSDGLNSHRYNLAKDCFILSFALIGINSVDLFECTTLQNNILVYNRKKTASRREDEAEIKIEIQPEIEHLIEKYKDPTGKRVFKFYQLYKDCHYFNAALNKGLKNVVPELEFYAARHSWATIASNLCNIDMYIIHSALNHVDEKMKITEKYVQKDFSKINKANRTVLDLVYVK